MPNLDTYNFSPDMCNKIRQGLEPKPAVGAEPAKKAPTVDELFAQNNLSPLSSPGNKGSEEEEDLMEDLRPTTDKGNKRLLSSPSSSPNKTSQKGQVDIGN